VSVQRQLSDSEERMMEETVDISVIIPLYNKAGTVARAVESVLAQADCTVEVVIVDDGSTDHPEQALTPYLDRVRLIRQANAGPSAARNRGVSASRSSVLAFLDADDEFLPGCLAAHLRTRQKPFPTQLSLASFKRINGCQECAEPPLPTRREGLESELDFFVAKGFCAEYVVNLPSGSICIDRTLFKEIGGFDERLRCWEITDFMLRAIMTSQRFALLPQVYVAIHEDVSNSQFSRTHGRTEYLAHFANKIADVFDDIPSAERQRFASFIRNALYQLMRAGEIAKFKALAARTCKAIPYTGEARRLYAFARLPDPLLKLINIARSLIDFRTVQ
jgi:glycosyltransferase involved in cell wall biosynthesis